MIRVRTFGSGRPVLFLHGIPTNGHLWDLMVERMASRFQCIVADISEMRELPALAAALDEIRAQHGIEKWSLVGHDGGCAIAVHYAHRFPDRVERLALLTPSLFPELKPFYLFEPLRIPVVGEILAPIVSLVFWNVVMRLAITDPAGRRVARDFRNLYRGLRGAWRFMQLLRWGNPREVLATIRDMLRTIEAPTAIFHGTHDPAVPRSFGQRCADLLPRAHLTVLDAGHFLPLNQSTAIADALVRFLGEEEAKASVPNEPRSLIRTPH